MKKTEPFTPEWLADKVRVLYGAGVIQSNSDIATAMKIHRSNVSNYLSGKVKPSKQFKEKFLELYQQPY